MMTYLENYRSDLYYNTILLPFMTFVLLHVLIQFFVTYTVFNQHYFFLALSEIRLGGLALAATPHPVDERLRFKLLTIYRGISGNSRSYCERLSCNTNGIFILYT